MRRMNKRRENSVGVYKSQKVYKNVCIISIHCTPSISSKSDKNITFVIIGELLSGYIYSQKDLCTFVITVIKASFQFVHFFREERFTKLLKTTESKCSPWRDHSYDAESMTAVYPTSPFFSISIEGEIIN